MKYYENRVAYEVKTVENMGYNHDINAYTRLVKDKDGNEFVIVKQGGIWHRWGVKNRIRIGTPNQITGQ